MYLKLSSVKCPGVDELIRIVRDGSRTNSSKKRWKVSRYIAWNIGLLENNNKTNIGYCSCVLVYQSINRLFKWRVARHIYDSKFCIYIVTRSAIYLKRRAISKQIGEHCHPKHHAVYWEYFRWTIRAHAWKTFGPHIRATLTISCFWWRNQPNGWGSCFRISDYSLALLHSPTFPDEVMANKHFPYYSTFVMRIHWILRIHIR